MTISPWFFIAFTVVFTAAAHLAFKQYAIRGGLHRLALTVGLFILIPGSTFLALRELTLAQVYLCTAAVPVLSLVAAHRFLGETIRRSHVLATAVIVIGIVLYQTAVPSP